MLRVLFLFGTRPEALKLVPVINEMKANARFETHICVTAQHRHMLDQVLSSFGIMTDTDLDLMTADQTLADLTAKIVVGVDKVIKNVKPDICLIQGDTTTVLGSALACFYNKVKVGHIEAGLRSYDRFLPYPEEINRVLATHISDFHFAPTNGAKQNLIKENIDEAKILVTGNTIIDTLLMVSDKLKSGVFRIENNAVNEILDSRSKFILVTAHRRENFGDGIENICNTLKKIAYEYRDIKIVFPVHLNPNVRVPVNEILGAQKNVHLIEPLDYISFIALLSNCFCVLTDSGGVQEEAPAFNKPVLVMRDVTERPEAVEAGLSKLVGTNPLNIFNSISGLIQDKELYDSMSKGPNPYGDGQASKRIVNFLSEAL